jgi:cytochrome b
MTATESKTATPPPAAAQRTRVKVWDVPLRLFHWLLVIAVAVAFLSSEEDSAFNQWHILAGWVAGILIVFRVAWGFVGGEHSRFVDFVRPSRVGDHIASLFRRDEVHELGHNPLGGISVLLLLMLTAVTVWTGAFGGEAAEDVHELVAWTLLAFVGLHIAAVLVMSLIERENLVRAMITGSKAAARHPGARDSRRPGPLALIVVTAVLAGTIYGVLQYDPKAFTLRPAEAFEQRSGPAAAALPQPAEREDKD